MDIASSFAALKIALDGLKGASETNSGAKIEAAISEIRAALLNAQEVALGLQSEATEHYKLKAKLEKCIDELESKLKRKEELFFKDQFFWKTDDATPFCPRCWEKDQEVIHVSPEFSEAWEKKRKCPACDKVYITGKVLFMAAPEKRRSQWDI